MIPLASHQIRPRELPALTLTAAGILVAVGGVLYEHPAAGTGMDPVSSGTVDAFWLGVGIAIVAIGVWCRWLEMVRVPSAVLVFLVAIPTWALIGVGDEIRELFGVGPTNEWFEFRLGLAFVLLPAFLVWVTYGRLWSLERADEG